MMADIKLGSSAAEVKSFLGLTDSNTDKDQWQDFLRISKDLHFQLDCDPVSWNELSWDVKGRARAQLQDLCRQRNLFSAHPDISPALTWRFNQLQKKGSKNSKNRHSEVEAGGPVEPTAATSDIDDRQQQQPQQQQQLLQPNQQPQQPPPTVNRPFDPVRNLH